MVVGAHDGCRQAAVQTGRPLTASAELLEQREDRSGQASDKFRTQASRGLPPVVSREAISCMLGGRMPPNAGGLPAPWLTKGRPRRGRGAPGTPTQPPWGARVV